MNCAYRECRQCIFSVFGGSVDITGEILHGKTSPLRHDGQGLYAGLQQDIPVTRYHSLAGTHHSLPRCLEVSSWIAAGPDGGKGIIMGVRHKELLVEGVQFHPESILTAEGRKMLSNFLTMQGGTWKENEHLRAHHSAVKDATANGVVTNGHAAPSNEEIRPPEPKKSILDEIYSRRQAAVEIQKSTPSQRMSDLEAFYEMDLAPTLISFPDRLRTSVSPLALAAEVKRASPSKGDIAPLICAPAQAKKYALAGASVISVLTEPDWFKGSIDDLRAVRQALNGMPNRPAVLRKEFIFDEYQILEARLAGADTVLLIVKMLSPELLRRLYTYSRSLGMEPLVEINTIDEMNIAKDLGARVIGINNRDLTNFEVDLETTSRLMKDIAKDTIICALSGISGPKDVEAYKKNGVGGVLVGEALMRHSNVAQFVNELMGHQNGSGATQNKTRPLVKICGTRTSEAAKAAVSSGADLVGIILVEGRKRTVSRATAKEISDTIHQTPKGGHRSDIGGGQVQYNLPSDYFEVTSKSFYRDDRSLLVGVFQNQPLSLILQLQKELNLDIVQLHGSEPVEWASLIPVPVLRRFGLHDAEISCKPYHALPLLDSSLGGTGEQLDTVAVREALGKDEGLRVALAGGLNPENVNKQLSQLEKHSAQVALVDVSSGVEDQGTQSIDKIRAFIRAVKE